MLSAPRIRSNVPFAFDRLRQSPSLLLLRLLVFAQGLVPLRRHALLSPLPSRLGLVALGLHLLFEDALTMLLGLGLVDLLSNCH